MIEPSLLTALLARCRFPALLAPASAASAASAASRALECAVSGGADSTALAVLAVAAGLQPTLVYVDHGLRPDSAEDGEVVATLASRLGLRFEMRSLDLGSGPNLEARARAARYGVLVPEVMTGHTADDLAETVLYNLARGASLDGLAPMRPGPGRPVRPLLGLRRHETVALCAELGYPTLTDPMNADPAFARVRIRREVLPLLDSVMARDVADVIARQRRLLVADAEFLDSLAAGLDPTDAKVLAAAPMPLASRAVRSWLTAAGVTEDVPTFILPRVTFGTHSRESIMAIALDLDIINEAAGFEQAGILGGNFLKNYKLTFDFRNSKVTFTPIKLEKE